MGFKIVRFLDEAGGVVWGDDRGDDTAEILEGAPYGVLAATGEVRRVVRRLAPVVPVNVFCIGLNYRAHARETGASLPERPVVFMKPTSALQDPDAPIRIPAACDEGPEVDYEGELAVVIGRAARDVPVDEALTYVAGYTCANDVSARLWQKKRGGGQWIRGKSFDTFCPLGPVLVPASDVPDPQALGLRTRLNGATVQDGHTGDMIFSVAELVAFLSRDTTLLPGTVILTGTPAGVGVARTPPLFLAPGDVVEVEIEGLGVLRSPVLGPAREPL